MLVDGELVGFLPPRCLGQITPGPAVLFDRRLVLCVPSPLVLCMRLEGHEWEGGAGPDGQGSWRRRPAHPWQQHLHLGARRP